jgi:hypothetical protein
MEANSKKVRPHSIEARHCIRSARWFSQPVSAPGSPQVLSKRSSNHGSPNDPWNWSCRVGSDSNFVTKLLLTSPVRLNLTIATRIHLIEPQWNPAVEAQAIGRALRFGQDHRVTIIRYIMQDTVEQVGSQ